jgi:glycosyltransferase involved in cell wall biosynthesis
MKIVISSGGKFHSFDLVKSLIKSYEVTFFSSYPEYYLKKFINNKNNFTYHAIILKEILQRVFLKILRNFFFKFSIDHYVNRIYEFLVIKKIKKIKNIKVFIGWSGFSYNTFKNLEYFTIKVLERGSTHIIHQNRIIKDLYSSLGLKNTPISLKIIEKELKEYNLADYIITSSTFSKKTFINNNISENKIFHIPYGCDINHFYPKKNSFKKKNKNFKILFVGEVSFRKGAHILLKSYRELFKKNKNIQLSIVGNVNNIFKNYINLNKHQFEFENVNFVKSQNYFDLPNFYNQSDIFVLPSFEEGLAIVNLQALSCNTPIISTPNSGCEDLIENNKHGIVIEPNNIDNLTRELQKCIDNPKILLNFIENINMKRNFYSIDRYSNEINNFYKGIVDQK